MRTEVPPDGVPSRSPAAFGVRPLRLPARAVGNRCPVGLLQNGRHRPVVEGRSDAGDLAPHMFGPALVPEPMVERPHA